MSRLGVVLSALTAGMLVWAGTGSAKTDLKPRPDEQIGRILIPKIGMDLLYLEDRCASCLPGSYPVHYAGTALPGATKGTKTVAIAGHRTTRGAPFARVPDLVKGDVVYLTKRTKFGGGTYRYRVTGKRPFSCRNPYTCEDASSGFSRMQVDKLILTTCDNRGYVRWFVYAFRETKKPL